MVLNLEDPARTTRPTVSVDFFTVPTIHFGVLFSISTSRPIPQRSGRVSGTIRRECLDHVITFDESSLRQTLIQSKTHLAVDKDAPEPPGPNWMQVNYLIAGRPKR